MRRWQLMTLSVLWLLPLLLFAGFGAWSLYQSGTWAWLWWTMPACWGGASLLWRRWGRTIELPLPELGRAYWTPQDRAAAAIIDAEQRQVADLPREQLTNPEFYTQLTRSLALKIAQHYHPRASDPLGSLSVVEILAAMHLLAEDVEELFLKNVPAGHLLTVSQWRLLGHAPGWWRTASNAGWMASIVMNPLNIGRYLISKVAMDPLAGQLQQNLLGAFYTLYVRQAGYYLIELNSGRLRGGSQRYREWLRRLETKVAVATPSAVPGPPAAPVIVTIAVIGQVKAGKSSLINVLLGARSAVADVLPSTVHVQRYLLTRPDQTEQLVLLDTSGYSDAGATSAQQKETLEAVRQADLVLLVLDARTPARDADVKVVRGLADWYAQQPRLKPPPMLAVLNKIDGLSPVLEWSPPYNWRSPTRPKERTIAGAADYVREVFGPAVSQVVAVCCDLENDRVNGVAEELVPAMSEHLDAARAAALLRELHGQYDRDKFKQLMGQMMEAGQRLVNVVDEFRK